MKKPRLIIGGIVLILLLAGAAFVGARLLNGQGLPGLSLGGQGFSLGGSNSNGVHINRGDIQPAKELPQTRADINGVLDHRQDNGIFVGTGKVMMSVRRNIQSGEVQTPSSHDGPTVEVLVTTQTKIYQDVTMNQFDGPPPEGRKIQQILESGSLDGIGQSSMIYIWGRKMGDRFIADILVYSPPAFIKR